MVRDIRKSYQKDSLDKGRVDFKGNKEGETSKYDINFKQIICQISGGVCEILGVKKDYIMGKEICELIPDCYKEVHKVRLSRFFAFDKLSIEEVSPSKVFHN